MDIRKYLQEKKEAVDVTLERYFSGSSASRLPGANSKSKKDKAKNLWNSFMVPPFMIRPDSNYVTQSGMASMKNYCNSRMPFVKMLP
jgi:hypothetical protein